MPLICLSILLDLRAEALAARRSFHCFQEDRITFVHIGQKWFFFFLVVCKGQVIVERIQ